MDTKKLDRVGDEYYFDDESDKPEKPLPPDIQNQVMGVNLGNLGITLFAAGNGTIGPCIIRE